MWLTNTESNMTEPSTPSARKAQLAKRYRAERRFRAFGIAAISTAGLILFFLMGSILLSSLPAFTQHYVTLDIDITERHVDTEDLANSDWRALARNALRAQFPEVSGRKEKRALGKLLSIGSSDDVRDYVTANPSSLGTSIRLPLTLSDDIDLLLKGVIDRDLPENERVVSNQDLAWLNRLLDEDRISKQFATRIFTNGDSREPELAGLRGALVGSLWTLLVTLLASFPLGVMAAIYLEEIAPKNRLTQIIEVNINNLAAVPSIVFGLLGLAVFINFFGMPRSAPLVGGLVLALMTLPRIIIPTRAAFAAIPPSIREAAMGVGASRLQVIMHHVLPLAMPGILTGTIIGLAQAAGETAPLLMIGMMAFIVDVPTDVTAKATVLPAQIYMWANNPERAFMARTSAGIVVLLSLLLMVNATAIYFRKRFEKRW
jgi:phosphate transport system permease protein